METGTVLLRYSNLEPIPIPEGTRDLITTVLPVFHMDSMHFHCGFHAFPHGFNTVPCGFHAFSCGFHTFSHGFHAIPGGFHTFFHGFHTINFPQYF
jgi:hypothetical protein